MREFGLQIYSIRDHFTNAEDTRKAFQSMREFGYSYAQTAGSYSYMSPEEFRKCADNANIRIVGTHYDWDKIENDVEETIRYHRILGTTNIGIGGMPTEARKTLEGLNAFIERFNKMAQIYAEHGFLLTYHNHDFEFEKLEGETIFDRLIRGLDPKRTAFVLDVYWAHVGGIDVRDMIERLKGRIVMLHLKDCRAHVKYKLENGSSLYAPCRVEVGEGNINFSRIIQTAEECGVEYFVVEDEVYSTGESMDSVRISAANIQKKFLS